MGEKLPQKSDNREVFQDLKGDYYTIDTQHGRFEKFGKSEYHIDEFNIDLEPQNKQKKGRKLRWN